MNRQNYAPRALRALWFNAPALLLGGLLFGLLSFPAVVVFVGSNLPFGAALSVLLVSPAWTALLAFAYAVVEGEQHSLGMFFRAFFRFYLRAVTLGAGLVSPGIPLALTLQATAMLQGAQTGAFVQVYASGFVFLYFLVLALYVFPMMVIHDLSLKNALFNALLLTGRHLVPTFGLAMLLVMCVLLVIYGSSGLLFFLPALFAVFSIYTSLMVVEEERSSGRSGSGNVA